MTVPGVGRQSLEFTSPRAINLDAGPGLADFDLTFHDLESRRHAAASRAEPGVLPRVERADARVSIVRRLSTLTSGTLYFESLNGATRALRAGEALRFSETHGEIRRLRLGKTTWRSVSMAAWAACALAPTTARRT